MLETLSILGITLLTICFVLVFILPILLIYTALFVLIIKHKKIFAEAIYIFERLSEKLKDLIKSIHLEKEVIISIHLTDGLEDETIATDKESETKSNKNDDELKKEKPKSTAKKQE